MKKSESSQLEQQRFKSKSDTMLAGKLKQQLDALHNVKAQPDTVHNHQIKINKH